MKRTLLIGTLLAIGGITPLAAQIQIPLDGLAAKASDTSGVSLDSSMLRLAANFLAGNKAQDPGFQKVLADVKSIAVRHYSFAQEGQYDNAELEPLRTLLRAGGWREMMSWGQQKGTRNEVYTKSDGGQIAGITQLLTAPKQVIVVSIEGSIDLTKLAELAGHFGIPTVLGGPEQKLAGPEQKPAGPEQKKDK